MLELTNTFTQTLMPHQLQTLMMNSNIANLLSRYRVEHELDTYEFAKKMDVDYEQMLQWLNPEYDFKVSEICYILNKLQVPLITVIK